MEINITYSTISLVILILLLIRQVKVWRFRVFLSPGFYFAAFWILGVFGLTLFASVDMIPLMYPEYIDELNILIGFTGLCFLLYTSWGRKKINEEAISVKYISQTLFNVLSIILLIAALYDFIRLGGNLNMGEARNNLREIEASRPTWIGYIETLSLPLSIYAGYKLFGNLLAKKKESFVVTFSLLLPLLANLFFSICVGGRVHFIYAFLYYLIGASLAIPFNQVFSQLKKPLLLLLVASVILITFISSVAAQRAEYMSGDVNEKQAYFEERYGALGFMYGPVEYMVASYYGYQFRRDDAVDLENLGYGKYTFNGFINWTIPFASQFGAGDLSIAKAFDVYYDNLETYDYERIAFECTHSAYIPLVKDFGASAFLFIVIALLTFLSHYLFVKIQQKRTIKYACSLFIFFLFWNYWVKSNYLGSLSSSILIPFYGFAIVDIVVYFSKGKQY